MLYPIELWALREHYDTPTARRLATLPSAPGIAPARGIILKDA
jgi:hypothetical protein